MKTPLSLPSVVSLLKKYDIHPKKRLGQNFLIAHPTLEKIVTAFGAHRDDVVIEIGSGLGVMTAMLAARCRHVFAIERDGSLLVTAREEFGGIQNISWINADFLQLDLQPLFRRHDCTIARLHQKIIGNIPYEITSPILFRMIEHRSLITNALLLMQREVAIRLVAKPHNKDYGILSILCQAFARCQRLFDVTSTNFIPPPKVMSSVVSLDFGHQPPVAIEDESWFRTIVRTAFGKRRKTLRNALLESPLLLDAKRLDMVFELVGIDGKRRPETLSVEDFVALAQALTRRSLIPRTL